MIVIVFVMIVIVKKFLRKVCSGLIAVRRDTRAHVPRLQKTQLTTKGKKWRKAKWRKKSPRSGGNKIVPQQKWLYSCVVAAHNNMLIG